MDLCVIGPVFEVGTTGKVSGTMILESNPNGFRIVWKQKMITGDVDASWACGNNFSVETSKFASMTLCEDLSFELVRNDGEAMTRKFQAGEVPFYEFVIFLQSLALNGVIVPCSTYSFEFYCNARPETYSYLPPWVRLKTEKYQGLEALWSDVLEMYENLELSLDEACLIPRDSAYPMPALARTSHCHRMDIVKTKYITKEMYDTVRQGEWPSLFDELGRLKDSDGLKKRLYFAGVEKELLKEAIMFILGVYPLNSTLCEREAISQSLEREFELLCFQLETASEQQIAFHKRRFSAFRVIDHDVHRTDRGEAAFKNVDGVGLRIIGKILKVYTIFNPPISYLQGMNDLVVPILFAFFPDWNEKSEPIDKEGNVITDWPKHVWKIFWCFEGLLRNVNHLELLSNVTEQTKVQSRKVSMILRKLSPMAQVMMKRSGLMELHWCYSDFILLFKRTFPNVWPVWLQLNCAPDPQQWLSFFIASIFLDCFEEMTKLGDSSVTLVMEAFPRMIKNTNLDLVGRLALWVANEMANDKDYQEFCASQVSAFSAQVDAPVSEFFKCGFV